MKKHPKSQEVVHQILHLLSNDDLDEKSLKELFISKSVNENNEYLNDVAEEM